MINLEIHCVLLAFLKSFFTVKLEQFGLAVKEGSNMLLLSWFRSIHIREVEIENGSAGLLLGAFFDYNLSVAFPHPLLITSFIIAVISAISIFLFIRHINNQKKETQLIIDEQGLLVNNLEQTILELEASKEETYKQQLFMRGLTMVLTHDLQSPFRFFSNCTEALQEAIAKRDYTLAEVLSGHLKESSKKTQSFLTDFTIWMKSISHVYKLKLEPVKVAELFTEIDSFFNEQLKCKKNELRYNVEGNPEIVTDKELLKIVLRNIVDNSNKQTKAGTILIEAIVHEGVCDIRIKDNGIGMPQTMIEKINSIKNNDPYHPTLEADERLGYKFIAHFSKLLTIDLQVDSQLNEGTCITLAGIPISK